MTIETNTWDVAEVLDTPEAIAAYLDAALEENDRPFSARRSETPPAPSA